MGCGGGCGCGSGSGGGGGDDRGHDRDHDHSNTYCCVRLEAQMGTSQSVARGSSIAKKNGADQSLVRPSVPVSCTSNEKIGASCFTAATIRVKLPISVDSTIFSDHVQLTLELPHASSHATTPACERSRRRNDTWVAIWSETAQPTATVSTETASAWGEGKKEPGHHQRPPLRGNPAGYSTSLRGSSA
eukprot:COSAG01_NODE_360_length_18184_cov_21.881780_9_plen_188_part_00